MFIVPCEYVNGAKIGQNEGKIFFVIRIREWLPIGFYVFLCAIRKEFDGGFAVVVKRFSVEFKSERLSVFGGNAGKLFRFLQQGRILLGGDSFAACSAEPCADDTCTERFGGFANGAERIFILFDHTVVGAVGGTNQSMLVHLSASGFDGVKIEWQHVAVCTPFDHGKSCGLRKSGDFLDGFFTEGNAGHTQFKFHINLHSAALTARK